MFASVCGSTGFHPRGELRSSWNQQCLRAFSGVFGKPTAAFRIIEGSPSGGKGVRAKLNGNLDRAFGAELSVDLGKQEVVLKVAGQAIKKKLARRLKQITHTGIVTWNAVTDFRLPGGH